MQQVIKRYIDQLSEKYPLDESGSATDRKEINTDEIADIVEQMVTEFSQNGIRHNCIISPNIKRNLDKLFIIYDILDECGYQAANQIENHDYIEPCKREAIIRLRMLYLRALNEIIYLLNGGYASASFGRSRAIFEIGVFLEIIFENNEAISKAFLSHSNFSRYEYVKALNEPEFKDEIWRSLLEINPDKHFWHNYQWAAPLINNGKNISFYDLAQITDLSKYYHFYKSSCQCAHATIIDCNKGIGLNAEEKGKPIWITGPSENGLDITIKMVLMFSEKIILKCFGLDSCQGCIIGALITKIIQNNSQISKG